MYSFDSRVRYSEVGEDGALTLPALIDYLQDCSSFHAESLGVGVEHVRRAGRGFLLAAWKIEAERLPRYCERIRVSTWATDFSGLLGRRNFEVRALGSDGAPGEQLVRADSLWFMFDRAAGAPIRIPEEEAAPYKADLADDEPLAMGPARRRIRVRGEGEPAEPVTVTRAHIDTNHHMNNAQYVSVALGVLPADEARSARRVDVQYCRAAKLGDVVRPHVHRDAEEAGAVVTLDDADGKPFAVVRLRA